MLKVKFGRTGLVVAKNGFGALPIQRMSLFLTRAPHSVYLTESWHVKMEQIDKCLNCGHCRSKCPYYLDTPALLRANLVDFRKAWAARA